MDYSNKKLEPKHIYLARPDKRLYGVLNGVDETSVSVKENANNTNSLSFTVYKNINGKPSAFYDNIDVLMKVFIDNEWYIINEPPQIDHDGIKEYKTVSAESAEIELSNYDLTTFLVGQGTEASCEMMYYNKHEKDFPIYEKDSSGNIIFDSNGNPKIKCSFPVVKFCDKDNPELSLLHLALYYAKLIPETISTDADGNEIIDWVSNIDKSPWKIGYIDTMPKEYIDYTVSFDGKEHVGKTRISYLPEESYAFNIDNSDLYSFLTQDVAGAFNCVFVFDTVNCLINAYYIDHIGTDTNAYIGWRNVQNSITATNTDDLYTAYTVSGGDGVTGIEKANFGSSEIEDYSYFMKDNRYLPQSLIDKYKSWIKFRESKRDSYIAANKNYWKSYDKATELSSRVPSDSSVQDWTTKSLKDLMSYYNDFTAMIRGYEKLYVDKKGNFDIEALKKSYSWSNYCEILNYTIPTIVNAITKKKDGKTEFPEELKSYGGGNLLSNAVFMTSSNWTNIENSILNIKDIDVAPAYGITRYASISSPSGETGIKQLDISVTKQTKYVLSAFIRSSATGSVRLGYSASSGDPAYTEASLSSGWARVHISFTAETNKCNVYFSSKEGTPFDICGVMLEIGEAPSSFNYFELDENYLKSCNTNWDLYGTKELEICLEDYSNRIDALVDYSEDYKNAKTDYSEGTYNVKHQLYLDYKKLYDDCNKALEQRKSEYDAAVKEYEQYNKEMLNIKILVQRENYVDKFTDEEENMLKKIYRHTDYTNENVITTDITSTDTTVDKQYALYLDAVENLYASSHPQYSYSDTLDNIYPLEEYKSLVETLHVYDFVHVEVNEIGHFENLRIISITRNPCVYSGELQVEFSTMRQYKSKRNDFASLLGSAVSAAKNSITMNSNVSDKTTSYSITPDFIKAILGSSGFSNYTAGIQSSAIDAITGNFTNLYSKYITADQITAQLIKADSAEFKTLVSESIQTDILTTKILNADKGFFDSLSTKVLDVSQANIEDLIAKKVTADYISTKLISGKNGDFIDFVNSNLNFKNITTELLTGTNSNTFIDFVHDKMKTGIIEAKQIQGENGETFIDLVNSSMDINKISTKLITGGDGNTFIDFLKNEISTSTITADQIRGKDGKTFIDLVNSSINIKQISTDLISGGDENTFINFLENKIQTSEISADKIVGIKDSKTFIDFVDNQIQTSVITADQITGWDGSTTLIDFINNTIQSSTIKADKITGISDSKTFIDFVKNQINTSELNTKVANINSLLSGSAGVGDLQTIHLTANNANIDEAVVKNLIAAKISVADLMTHSASAELITLISQDGKPSIAFKGSTQQFYDSSGNVRIQMGQDAKGDFTFSLFDNTGTGVLIDSKTGVHANAIANGLIVNDMIKDGTVSKSKLGFEIVEPNEQGGIDISTIYDGEEKWGAQYISFKESTINSLDGLDRKIDDSIPFQLFFTTSVGSDLAYGVNPSTVVTIHLYRDGKEVTDDYQDSNFIWTRTSADNAGDIYWNEKHSEGSKQITLSLSEDVLMGADFNCSFILDGEVLATLNDN